MPSRQPQQERGTADGCAADEQPSRSRGPAFSSYYDLMRETLERDHAFDIVWGSWEEHGAKRWSWPLNLDTIPTDSSHHPRFEQNNRRYLELHERFLDVLSNIPRRLSNIPRQLASDAIPTVHVRNQAGPDLLEGHLNIPSVAAPSQSNSVDESCDRDRIRGDLEPVLDNPDHRPIDSDRNHRLPLDPGPPPIASNSESEIQSCVAELGSSEAGSRLHFKIVTRMRAFFAPFNACVHRITRAVCGLCCTHRIADMEMGARAPGRLVREYSNNSSPGDNNFDRVIYFGNDDPPRAVIVDRYLFPPRHAASVGPQADNDNAHRRRSYPERTSRGINQSRMLAGYRSYAERMREERGGRDVSEIVNESRCADSSTSFLCIDLCCPQGPAVDVNMDRHSMSRAVTEWLQGVNLPQRTLYMRRMTAPCEPTSTVDRQPRAGSAQPDDASAFHGSRWAATYGSEATLDPSRFRTAIYPDARHPLPSTSGN